MKRNLLFTSMLIAGIAACFSACNREESTPQDTKYTSLNLPSTPYSYNALFASDEMIALGRVLFYDGRLSVNSSISCGTCHKQVIGFSDDDQFSLGFQNKKTNRNTLPIQNLRGTNTNLFWDGRETSLQSMVSKPILNHVEMGMDNEGAIVKKLEAAPYYRDLFRDAYGSEEVNMERVSEALASFTRSIVSDNTLFDKYLSTGEGLNAQQEMGMNLFFSKYNCNGCHQSQQAVYYDDGSSFSNIGLDENYADNGVGALTNEPSKNGMFKIPSLRNIALTGPYMHDGRFATLEEVIDHYSSGIKSHPNLDPRLRDVNNAAIVLNITDTEKEALVAFLKTLTDYTMITDVRFSNPFQEK